MNESEDFSEVENKHSVFRLLIMFGLINLIMNFITLISKEST